MPLPLKTLLRLNGPFIALLGIALLAGYENLGKDLPRYALPLYLIPIWAGLGNLILYLNSEKPVEIRPQQPTAESHDRDRQRLLQAAGFVSALFLLRLLFLKAQPSWLESGESYLLFAAIISLCYGILLLNSMERAQPGILKKKAAGLAPWDYPALLTAGLVMTLSYPLDPEQPAILLLDALLAACITLGAGMLYAEHRGIYGPRPAPPAAPEKEPNPARPYETPEEPPPT